MLYAEVVFNIPIDHAYTYQIPDELNIASPGIRVLAPLGKRTITGIVVNISECQIPLECNFANCLFVSLGGWVIEVVSGIVGMQI